MNRFDVTGISDSILFSRHKEIPPNVNRFAKTCAWCVYDVPVGVGLARYEPDFNMGQFAIYHKLCLEYMIFKFGNRSRMEVGRIIKERCRLDGNSKYIDALIEEGNKFCKHGEAV